MKRVRRYYRDILKDVGKYVEDDNLFGELIELVASLIDEGNLWVCKFCGEINKKSYICYNCKYDPTLID